MLKRILAYVLFALGVLVMLFFRKYTGELIPYPFVFWLAGLALFVAGLFLLKHSPTPKEKEYQQQIAKAINELKLNGDK